MQTTITYTLPEAANVTFTVSDATGRTLEVRRTSGVQGANTLTLQRNDLPAGVLFYCYELPGIFQMPGNLKFQAL